MSDMRKWLYLLCGTVLLYSPSASAENPNAPEQIPGAIRVSAEQVVRLIQDTPNLVVIDARKAERYKAGHIQGAINLLDTALTQLALSAYAPSRNTPMLFYCNGARCLRSANAVHKAVHWGYTRIYWFRGGWQEWTDKELPIAR